MTVKILFFQEEMLYAEKWLKITQKEQFTDTLTRCTIELDSPSSVHEIWHTAIKFFIQKKHYENVPSTPLAPIL